MRIYAEQDGILWSFTRHNWTKLMQFLIAKYPNEVVDLNNYGKRLDKSTLRKYERKALKIHKDFLNWNNEQRTKQIMGFVEWY